MAYSDKSNWMPRAIMVVGLCLAAACGSKEATPAEDDVIEQPLPAIDDAGMAVGEEVEPLEVSDAAPYVGEWSADPSLCGIAPGSAEPAPIAFTEGEFIGYENFCRIAYVDETGPMMWTIERVCDAEGVEYTDLVSIAINDGVLTLTNPDGASAEFQRCE